MSRPTKPVPAPAAGSKPWQMFPPVVTTSRRSPITSPLHASSPLPPGPARRDEKNAAAESASGDPASERPAMSAPAAAGAARDA
jgi:hypothetical protein